VSESKAADKFEPLIVGLKIFLGEEPQVAQEILEVGQDIAERIRQAEQEGDGDEGKVEPENAHP
jgi:hypothetical protein